MKIYHYTNTGEFAGSSDARIDPLETKKQGEDVYLVPAMATLLSPPETGEHEIPVMVDGAWVVRPDYRERIYYDTDTAAPVEIDEIGVVPGDNLTDQKPGPYDKWTGSAWAPDLNTWLDRAVRPERNVRLAACDYLMMPDYPLKDKTPWESYRAALRGLPAMLSEIVDPIPWPARPEQRM